MASAKQVNEYDRCMGERIREARLARGMSQKEVAELIGVCQQQLQKYETGADHVPSGRINRLVTALHKPVHWFFPDAADVRTAADPLVTKFIASKDGYRIASQWFQLQPHFRGMILEMIAQLPKDDA